MDLNLATSINERMQRCCDSLVESITMVQPHLTDSEFKAYALQIGYAVGEIAFAVLFPLYAAYPNWARSANHFRRS